MIWKEVIITPGHGPPPDLHSGFGLRAIVAEGLTWKALAPWWLCPELTYRLIWVVLNSGCTSETLGGLEDSRTHPVSHIPGVLDSPTAPSPQEFSWQSLFLWAFLDQPFWFPRTASPATPNISSWTAEWHPLYFLPGARAVGSVNLLSALLSPLSPLGRGRALLLVYTVFLCLARRLA